MKIEIFTQSDCFDNLRNDWDNLLQRVPSHTIFSTWEWASTWWSNYKPGKLWLLTYKDDTDRLVGITPCFIDNTNVIRGIGCEDVTDYYDLIIDPDFVDEVLQAFVDILIENKTNYPQIQLCNFREDSPILKQFPQVLSGNGVTVQTRQQEVCPIISLPDTWDDYLDQLPKKQRHEIRRKLRRSEGSDVTVGWYILNDSHNIDEEIVNFLRLMAASDQKKNDFLKDENNLAFFKNIIPLMYSRGWLQLNFLTIEDEPIATYFNFLYDKQVLVYNSGLNTSDYGYLSPGIILLAHNIQYAIENAYQTFDFLRGNETYKYRMGGKDINIYEIIAQLGE